MINLNLNHTNYTKNNRLILRKQSFKAVTEQQQKNNLTYEQSVINYWTGLSAIIFGGIGFLLPRTEGTNKEVAVKLLTRNLPLGIIGGLIGATIGAVAGKRKAEEHKLFLQSITNIQKNQN